MILENLGDRLVGGKLDFMIGIDERNFKLLGESAANAGFSRTHQADEHNGMISELFADIFYLF